MSAVRTGPVGRVADRWRDGCDAARLYRGVGSPLSWRDRGVWTSAQTLADLGAVTADWLEGSVRTTPFHYGPPDPETADLIPTLAHVNRAGFVTDSSQPGEVKTVGGRLYRQRAGVEGWAEPEVEAQLRLLVDRVGSGLVMTARPVGGHWSGVGSVVVTDYDGSPETRFGSVMGRDDVIGDGLSDSVVARLLVVPYVTIVDMEWGRNDRLWPVLDALTGVGR